jgi:hypothetical protein
MKHIIFLVIAGVCVRVLTPYAQAFFSHLPPMVHL